jgi:glycosyltransferase involved in cell wall biosynthesis
LRKYEKEVDIIHIFFPYLVNFRILEYFSKPVIFTIVSGVQCRYPPGTGRLFTVVVSSDEERDILKSLGIGKVHMIRPGIDFSRIATTSPPCPDHDFLLLMGSAPWTKNQFEWKGFNLMLEVLPKLPGIRLVCLWRGKLYHEWCAKIQAAGLADRVEIIHEKADISGILSRCHAAMVLADRPDLVKSYPNSLMEALVAGRPVIVSRAIPLSSYVDQTGCGIVIEKFSPDHIIHAINEMRDHYDQLRSVAVSAGRRDFSCDRMVHEYRDLYERILINPPD